MILTWHVYASGHWYDVAAETLACLRGARYPGALDVHLTGDAGAAYDLRELAGWYGFRPDVTRHEENQYEFPALRALWRSACRGADRLGYVHTKGVTRPGLPAYVWWRWMMLGEIVARWPDRLSDLERYDAVGCCYRPDWPCFAGNFWWARGDWIRRLPEPIPSVDRYDCERWVLTGPGCRVKALVSIGGEPCRPEYYRRNGQPQWLKMYQGQGP